MSASIGSVGSFDPTTLWANLFKKIDANNDGNISKTEFESAISTMASGQNVTTSEADAMFKQLDTNGDGSVSKSEMMSALQSLGQQMQASMPPPPPMDNSQNGQDQALTDDQKKTVDSILSKYDASNLTASDVKAINKSISDAGISFGKSLGDEIESQGFSVQTMMSLSPPPANNTSASTTDASTTSASATSATSQIELKAENSLLSDLVNYLSSLSSSNSSTDNSTSTQFSDLLQSLKSSTGTSDDQTTSLFNDLVAMLQTSTQYSQTGSLSYETTTQQSLLSTYA
jgi:EF-hand domain pair